MNIFYLDQNLELCAQSHIDRHIVKMVTETSQLLATAHWQTGTTAPIKQISNPGHGSAVWTRQSLSNYKWLIDFGDELAKEYTYRYGKIHKSFGIIEWARNNIPNIKDIGITPFYLAMPDEFKTDDPVISYRKYYQNCKQFDKRGKPMAKWKSRPVPSWWFDVY